MGEISNSPPPPLWTVEQVAGFLQVQCSTVRRMAREGHLPAMRIGKAWRFDAVQMHTWLAERKNTVEKRRLV